MRLFLAVSGSLNPALYGPSVYPEIPKEILAAQSRPGKDWFTERMSPEEVSRRSVYISVKRSLIYPFTGSFDLPETDRSSVGIYFAPPQTRQLVLEIKVMENTLEIPAGDARFHKHASYTLPVQTTLLDIAPHMHYLGREVRAEAHLPDGKIEPLIWIKDWDFDWQGQYIFAEPLRFPAGTKIECDFYFDNSAGNPRNPHHPPKQVSWGEQSKEEMAICHLLYTCDNLRDLQLSQLRHMQTRAKDREPGNAWHQPLIAPAATIPAAGRYAGIAATNPPRSFT